MSLPPEVRADCLRRLKQLQKDYHARNLDLADKLNAATTVDEYRAVLKAEMDWCRTEMRESDRLIKVLVP